MTVKQQTVVAVSGFGGSGKSTLAEKMKAHFSDSTLLQLDNFLIALFKPSVGADILCKDNL